MFFFHPLVHWLLGRLDRERELLCDEVVVASGTERAGYARMLLELAKRPGRIGFASAGVRPALLPFLDRRTVAIRISRLLEDDMLRTLSQRSARRSLILGSLAVAVALGLTGVRVRAVETQVKQEKNAAVTTQSKAAPKRSRKIEGVILDPDGKPVIGATVVGGIDETGNRNHQVFQTDQNGRFEWSIPERPVLIYFVAYKKGFSPAFWVEWMTTDLRGDHVESKLGKPQAYAAVLVDNQGSPIPGANVQVEMIDWASESGSMSFFYVRRDVLGGSPVEGLFTATTALDGSFVLSELGPVSGVKLAVTTGDGRRFVVRPEKRRVIASRRWWRTRASCPQRRTERHASSPCRPRGSRAGS